MSCYSFFAFTRYCSFKKLVSKLRSLTIYWQIGMKTNSAYIFEKKMKIKTHSLLYFYFKCTGIINLWQQLIPNAGKTYLRNINNISIISVAEEEPALIGNLLKQNLKLFSFVDEKYKKIILFILSCNQSLQQNRHHNLTNTKIYYGILYSGT